MRLWARASLLYGDQEGTRRFIAWRLHFTTALTTGPNRRKACACACAPPLWLRLCALGLGDSQSMPAVAAWRGVPCSVPCAVRTTPCCCCGCPCTVPAHLPPVHLTTTRVARRLAAPRH